MSTVMRDAEKRAETAEAALARVEALAKIQATSLRAAHRADMARNWLDVLAIIERAALAQPATDEGGQWCRREDCRHRHWRSGDMPTHRRGDDCPATDEEADSALPLHRTEAGWPRCSTCDGGGCPDCTDPA